MIAYPDLEIRNEDRLVAETVARVSGGLTEEIAAARIREWAEILKLVQGGLDSPICAELTNANPSSPHTVILEAMGWALAQQAHKFNQVPLQNFVAFANLFGIEPRTATAATTILRFTVSPPLNTDVTIPANTQVETADGLYVFETTESLVILYGQGHGDIEAVRTVPGHTLLSAGVLTKMIDNVAFVAGVTNQAAIDSGTELESIDATLDRVKRYQHRGERIVSTKDLEDAIAEEALEGNGVVRAFPFVRSGEFTSGELLAGYTTVIVMTKTGDNIDSIATQRIANLLDEAVGNQFIYIVNPSFVTFDVGVTVRLNTGSPQGAVVASIERNLRNFYAASREQFGRPILRSEIIAVVEGTGGVDRIVVTPLNDTIDQNTPILAAPLADVYLAEYQLPRLVDVDINVV